LIWSTMSIERKAREQNALHNKGCNHGYTQNFRGRNQKASG
jgi:hypothetical protein